MPPKNKKQLEEQAKRLEQQQRRKQQEERRLQQQRKKYAAQKINTGLLLPVSNQLIADFLTHQSSFIDQKLKQVLNKQYDSLKDQKVIRQLCKQIIYHIKNLRRLFELKDDTKQQQSTDKLLKIRVVCGLFLQIYLQDHPSLSSQNSKNKQQDQNLLKRLLLNHSQSKTQNQKKIFSKQQIVSLLSYFKDYYFSHFLILHSSRNFSQREDQKTFTIHIASPSIEFNNIHTTFVDLSGNKKELTLNNENEEKKSDE